MIAAERQQGQAPSEINPMERNLLTGLFFILGLAPFLYLILTVWTNPAITAAVESAERNVILAFLDIYGIILPLLLILFGVFALQIAWRLRSLDINAAAWARLILFWLAIGAGFLGIFTLVSTVLGGDDLGAALPIIIVAAVVTAVSAFGYMWLNRNLETFEGSETLYGRSTRTAWNLLIPTVAVLIVVAARPLEQTFITSLTDRRFASGQDINFVGFQNYAELLGIRIDTINCVEAEGGGCATEVDDGVTETVFPRPRDVLDEGYRELRYREVSSIQLGGTQLLLSARDRDFISSIGNTLTFTFFSVVIELILGLFIALVVNSNFAGRGVLRAAMLVPWAIPTVVSARLWEVMLRDNQSGIINQLFLGTGLIDRSQAWLANPNLQIPAMVAIDVWKTTPFMALILLAGLQVIPKDMYEAADVDGASRVRQFFSLTLPLLRPTIAVALVFRTLDAIRVFDVFQVLLGRQKLSMAVYNYDVLVNNQQFGYASAVGVLIFVLILIFTILYVRILGVSND